MTITRKEWYEIWSLWILLIMITFGVLEGFALGDGGVTLSRYVWDVSQAWPLILVIYGMLVGGLAVHFWWHWMPPGAKSSG